MRSHILFWLTMTCCVAVGLGAFFLAALPANVKWAFIAGAASVGLFAIVVYPPKASPPSSSLQARLAAFREQSRWENKIAASQPKPPRH